MTTESPFDMEAFMGQTVEAEGSTVLSPIPQGEYMAMIEDVTPRAFARKDGKGHGMSLDIVFSLVDDDGKIREAIDGRDPKFNQAFFCDTDTSGRLDMSKGKNIQLNRLRAALGQNTASAWSPLMLKGQGPVKITTGIEQSKQDSQMYFTRLKAVGTV